MPREQTMALWKAFRRCLDTLVVDAPLKGRWRCQLVGFPFTNETTSVRRPFQPPHGAPKNVSSLQSNSTMSETDQAKLELTQCEQEISQVKALLRGLGPGGEMDEGNRLSVVWIGVRATMLGGSTRFDSLTLYLHRPKDYQKQPNLVSSYSCPRPLKKPS